MFTRKLRPLLPIKCTAAFSEHRWQQVDSLWLQPEVQFFVSPQRNMPDALYDLLNMVSVSCLGMQNVRLDLPFQRNL